MTLLPALRRELASLLDRTRTPVQQHKTARANGSRWQLAEVPSVALTAGDRALLEAVLVALRAARGVRLQEPVEPRRTQEEIELELLRAQVRPSIAPLESAAENPGVGSRV